MKFEGPPQPNPNENPEPSVKSERAVEKEGTETIARDKLRRILDENFRDFAVRFMNFDEYRDIIERNFIRGQEVFIPSVAYSGPPLSFNEYLERSKKDWADTIYSETNWEFAIRGLKEYKDLIKLFKQAHAEEQTRRDPQNIKINTLRKLHQILIDPESVFDQRNYSLVSMIISSARRYNKNGNSENKNNLKNLVGSDYEKILDFIENMRDPWHGILYEKKLGKLTFPDDKEEKLKEIVEAMVSRKESYKTVGGEDAVAIVNEFIENPEVFVSSKKLHDLFQALTKGPKREGDSQYQIGLIFDMIAVNKTYGAYWEPLKRYAEGDPQKPKHDPKETVLAAIVILPDREFTKEVANLSANSGSWSHPVFDNKGILRYPKQEEFAAKEQNQL